MAIRAILWYVDGTLLDFAAAEKAALQATFSAFGLGTCTEEMMASTRDGKALYLHCLPADINDVSCKDGEVAASVFDRYRDPLYKQASYKPYIIAAMIFLAKQADPAGTLEALAGKNVPRHMK